LLLSGLIANVSGLRTTFTTVDFLENGDLLTSIKVLYESSASSLRSSVSYWCRYDLGLSTNVTEQEPDHLQWTLVPNPVHDQLMIKGLPDKYVGYSIRNTLGQEMDSGTRSSIDVTDLPAGQYFLSIYAGGSTTTQSFVKG